MKKFLIVVVGCVALWVGSIYFYQERMIYFPRGYSTYSKLFKEVDQVKYRLGEDSQTSFLFPKERTEVPDTVWWLFGGNGSTALDWVSFLERGRFPEGHVFVLVEYPGYGRCRGKPSPDSIANSVDALFATLSERWGLDKQALASRSRTLGHSLGAAIALDTAARYEMNEVVAVSPFTSMQEMAKRRVGWLHRLLKHHYDNRRSIQALSAQTPPARIHVYHGSRDSLIPMSMGKELVTLADNDRATFQPVKGRGHNDILYSINGDLITIIKSRQ